MATVQVDTLVAQPGQTARGWVRLISLPDGSPAQLPVVIINGVADGPRLWISAAVHGNEYCGTRICLEAAARLAPETLRGAAIFVPALNVTAFQAGTRRSPWEYYGTGDLNRTFPGSPEGTYTEQMAHRIYGLVRETATHALDLHTGAHPDTLWALYPDGLGETTETAREMARVFGVRDVVGWQASFLQQALFAVLAREGVPGIVVEAGGAGNAFTPETVRAGVAGIFNVLALLHMTPDGPPRRLEYRELRSFAWVRGRTGGVFTPHVRPGDRVRKGQVIATMTSLVGEAIEDISSPVDGAILTLGSTVLMPVGGTVAQIGVEEA